VAVYNIAESDGNIDYDIDVVAQQAYNAMYTQQLEVWGWTLERADNLDGRLAAAQAARAAYQDVAEDTDDRGVFPWHRIPPSARRNSAAVAEARGAYRRIMARY
jgi:hypothetical protein